MLLRSDSVEERDVFILSVILPQLFHWFSIVYILSNLVPNLQIGGLITF